MPTAPDFPELIRPGKRSAGRGAAACVGLGPPRRLRMVLVGGAVSATPPPHGAADSGMADSGAA
jgi:hypothetical protein